MLQPCCALCEHGSGRAGHSRDPEHAFRHFTSPGWKQGFLATMTSPVTTSGESSRGLRSIWMKTCPYSSSPSSSMTPMSRAASGT